MALGASNADFLVADVSDHDAGWYALAKRGSYDNFWTDQKAMATLGFYKTMAETRVPGACDLHLDVVDPAVEVAQPPASAHAVRAHQKASRSRWGLGMPRADRHGMNRVDVR